jgi:L,D-transpeptidase YcbB
MNRSTRLVIAASLAVTFAAAPLRAQDAQPAVDAYYAAHDQSSIWLRDEASRAAARDFADILRDSAVDGLTDGAELARQVETASARGQPDDDRIISAVWVRFVQTLEGPADGIDYGDPARRPTTPAADFILAQATAAPSLADHVHQIADVNPFYSAIREAAVKHGATADPHVRATLERLRLVPAKGRVVLVDAASAQLLMVEDGHVVDSMKVVVGKKETPSAPIASTINFVTFNPYWHIPDNIARDKVAPIVVKRGVSYLKAARYETAASYDNDAVLVDPVTIDWKAVSDGSAPVYIRQLPGSANMMGAIKFPFDNRFDIYLHDTPHDARHLGLFEKGQRNFSNGCIRLEHADRLGRWLLGRDPVAPNGDPEQHVKLEQGVPIYVTYMTANVENGELVYAEDVYGLDTPSSPATTAAAPQTATNAAPQ